MGIIREYPGLLFVAGLLVGAAVVWLRLAWLRVRSAVHRIRRDLGW